MTRAAAVLVLQEIGRLLELQGENPFKVRAFQAAARALERLDGELDHLLRSGRLARTQGLGPATMRVVEELVRTGSSSLYRELRERTPDGLIQLLSVPGLGARRIHQLHQELGVASLDDLETALATGRVARLAGFGERTAEKLWEGVAFRRTVAGRRRRPEALDAALPLLEMVRAQRGVARAELTGALRRRLETVDGVDLVAVPASGVDVDPVLTSFLGLPGTTGGERLGPNAGRARLADGLEVRLQCLAPEAFAAGWLHGTGSPSHLAALRERARSRGLRLHEDGLRRGRRRLEAAEEADIYAALGLAFVPPELREGRGEVEAAAASKLPRLVELSDLRGCFHCHTVYSDGRAPVAVMAAAALARGWRYLGLADHSQAARYVNGLSPDAIRRQHEEVDAWNEERGHEIWLFKGIEADILSDGRLDYAEFGDEILGSFDYVVGSVHGRFGQDEREMTRRVLRALENPFLTFLGHPTGRLLLAREGYRIDMDAVIDAAGERGVGIEINSNPRRLDLDWRHWPRAREKGIRCAVNPDAHSTGGLDDVRWGVDVARKGWLTKEDVVNTWELDEVQRYFDVRRAS